MNIYEWILSVAIVLNVCSSGVAHHLQALLLERVASSSTASSSRSRRVPLLNRRHLVRELILSSIKPHVERASQGLRSYAKNADCEGHGPWTYLTIVHILR